MFLVARPVPSPDLARLVDVRPSPTFSALDPEAAQYLGPRLDGSAGSGHLVTQVVARGFAALPFGAGLYRADLLAAVAGAIGVAFLVPMARHVAGGGWLAALVAALALAAGPTYWSRAVVAGGQVTLAPCLMATLFGLVAWTRRRRTSSVWMAAALFGLGVDGNPELAILLPGVIVWIVTVEPLARPRVTAIAPFVAGAAAGLAHHGWAARLTWSSAGWIDPGVRAAESPVRAIAGIRGLLPVGPALEVGDVAGGLATAVASEWGLLGLVLLTAGVLRLVASSHPHLRLLAVSAATGAAWALLAGIRQPTLLLVPVLWSAYPVVAAGIASVLEHGTKRSARVLATVVVLALPAIGYFTNRAEMEGRQHRRAFLGEYVERVLHVLPANRVLVSESEELDRALTQAAYVRWGDPIPMVPAVRAALATARTEGHRLLGFEVGSRRLVANGLRRTRVRLPDIDLSLADYLRSIPEGHLVAAATGPQFHRVVEPSGGATFAAIGGTVELLLTRGANYGVLGVVGSEGPVLEELGAATVDRSVQPGDPLGSRRSLAPVRVRIVSRAGGARIDVHGETIARVREGLALVVLSPDGFVIASHRYEPGEALRLQPMVSQPVLFRLDVPGRPPQR